MRNVKFLSVILSCVFLFFPVKSDAGSNADIINRVVKPLVNKEKIRVKKDAIAKDYSLGKKIDYGVAGTVSLLGVFFAYKFIKYCLKKDEPEIFKTLSKRKLTSRMIVLEDRLSKITKSKFLSKDWFFVLAQNSFTGFVSSSFVAVGLKAFNTCYEKYHCFDNLHEFIGAKFGDLHVLDELLYNAQLFDVYKTKSSDDLQMAVDRFVISLRNVVDIIEYIIAAMEYRVDSFENIILSQEDLLISKYLFDSLHNYSAQVVSILDGKLDQGMLAISNDFKHDVERLIASFIGLENRVAWLS